MATTAFDELDAGTYRVVKVLPNNWINTTSTSITIELKSGEMNEDNNFRNICLMQGYGGKTLGYWANAGNKQIRDDDLSYLNSLECLYKFNVATFRGRRVEQKTIPPLNSAEDVKIYLLSANARDMRFMLSTQLITIILNVHHECLDNSTIVSINNNGNGCFIKIGEIIENAYTALCNSDRIGRIYWTG